MSPDHPPGVGAHDLMPPPMPPTMPMPVGAAGDDMREDTPTVTQEGDADHDRDRQLAMAIEASYNAQTEGGRQMSDEELMMEALRVSRNEEEARQRRTITEQQDRELEESMLIDRMREQESKRQEEEEEQLRRMEAQRLQDEAQRSAEDAARKSREVEDKRARLPTEPPAGEAGRLDFQIRLPDGKRLRRAFRAQELVGSVYDYVDLEGGEAVGEAQYRLVSTMPRCAYEDRSLSLAQAELKGGSVLLVEPA